MRRTLFLGSVAVVAGSALVGCGGSSNNSNLNTATRIAVGYVYVRANNSPQATPAVVVSTSSVAPSGYAAPTAGTVTMSVTDGTITRDADSENFNMATSNVVIARVTSRSSGNPSFSLAFSGIELNGESKSAPATTSFDIGGGTENTVFPISLNAPTYTVGAASSMRVLIKDPSTLYGGDEQNRFAAPADVIGNATGDSGLVASASAGDRYEVAVLLHDANGVLIPGTTFSVADTSLDAPSAAAVTQSGSLVQVVGGGTEGAAVELTFTSPQAPGMETSYTSFYSYGNPVNFSAAFSAPTDPASVIWPDTGTRPERGLPNGSPVTVDFILNNGRGIPVSGQSVNFQVRDARETGTPAAFASNNWPSPATGPCVSANSTVTTGGGVGSVTFLTPTPAAGNSAFNSLNIKYGTGCKVDVLIGTTVLASKVITVTRPLSALVTQGSSRLDAGTASQTNPSNASAFRVTGATDIDTQSISAPVGTYTWTITPNSAGSVGDPDDVSPRSVAIPTITGSATGSSIQILAGANSGSFTTVATFNGTNSNTLTTQVFGPPSKVLVTRTPGASGLTGTAGSSEVLTLSFLDGFGHDVTAETTVTAKNGTIVSSPGGQLTFPSAPSRNYNLTFPTASGGYNTSMGVTLSWTGTGQGTSVGSASGLNITRNVNVIVP